MEMTIKARDFWKSVPLQYVSDGFIVSKTGDITIGWEITLPGIFSCDARSLLEIPESLYKAISFLPPWMMVHRQDVYYRRGYRPQRRSSFLGQSFEKHYQGRGYLVHRQYIYLTVTSKQSALRPHSSSGLFLMHFLSGKVARERAVQLLSVGNDFISTFTSSGMVSARRLTDDERLTFLERDIPYDPAYRERLSSLTDDEVLKKRIADGTVVCPSQIVKRDEALKPFRVTGLDWQGKLTFLREACGVAFIALRVRSERVEVLPLSVGQESLKCMTREGRITDIPLGSIFFCEELPL